jgi:hypothetical protein
VTEFVLCVLGYRSVLDVTMVCHRWLRGASGMPEVTEVCLRWLRFTHGGYLVAEVYLRWAKGGCGVSKVCLK